MLRLAGDVDMATEDEWRTRSAQFLAAHPDVVDVRADLGDVSFIDSRGMSVLVHLHTAALQRGGQLVVQHAPATILRSLGAAGLDQVFRVAD